MHTGMGEEVGDAQCACLVEKVANKRSRRVRARGMSGAMLLEMPAEGAEMIDVVSEVQCDCGWPLRE